MALLSVADLTAGYKDVQILNGVDITVDSNEYVALVGPNGAGKSTLMKSVFGLTTYYDGSIEFKDESIVGADQQGLIERGISYVPQADNVFPPLTVDENLKMGAYVRRNRLEDALDEVLTYFPVLAERRSQKAGTLSGGQQQMLAMARALMLKPDLLLLDEPSAGLAPDLVDDMFDRIDAINDRGTAVLIVEQNAKEALRRCDRGYVLVQGEHRHEGPGTALLESDEIRQEFLGG